MTAPPEPASPFVPDGHERRLDPRWVVVSRLAGAITVAIMGGMLLIGVVITLIVAPLPTLARFAFLGGWLAFVAGLGLFVLLWPPVAWRHLSYAVDERGLCIRRGVLWRSIVSVPRSRVQHTDVSQGPIERAFELSTLIVHTAGTEQASVSLGGLDRATALAIRDHLIEGGAGGDDAV